VSSPQPADAYVNCIYTIKILQKFRQLGIPLTIIFPQATHKPAHNNACGPLPYKVGDPWSNATEINRFCFMQVAACFNVTGTSSGL